MANYVNWITGIGGSLFVIWSDFHMMISRFLVLPPNLVLLFHNQPYGNTQRTKGFLGLMLKRSPIYHQNTRKIVWGSRKNTYVRLLKITVELYRRIRRFFEKILDSRSCYVTQRIGTTIEPSYFKPTFKNSQSNIGIWNDITLRLKWPVYFLKKKSCMNFNIYCEHVLDKLSLPFYKHCIQKKVLIILIDNRVRYSVKKWD